MIPMDLDFTAKQESINATASSTSTTTTWSTRSKDPRIVRVSRAFGGKDRHSKVCTVKGLRDRRVRLSVPTAIQLYDLQERLGLNQPSKVVDWLLNAAKSEIDELPPLQIPQEMQPMMMISSAAAYNQNDHHRFLASQNDDPSDGNETGGANWSSRNDDEEENEISRQYYYNNFLSRSSVEQNNPSSSLSSWVNGNNGGPYNINNNSSLLRWEYPSNLTLSQPPISLGLASAQVVHHDDQDLQNFGRFVQFHQPYNNADDFVHSQNNNVVSEQNRHNEPRFL